MPDTNVYRMADADRPLADPEDVDTPARGDDMVGSGEDDDDFDDEDEEELE
jgi:hypothetical protein